MAWNYITLTITSCAGCPHSRANKVTVVCAALDGKRLCWVGADEDKLQTIPDFCPHLEKTC